MVPKPARTSSSGRFPFFQIKSPRSRSSTRIANTSATALRKKLFCMDGKSPANRTKTFMSAKQNAEQQNQQDSFCFVAEIL